MLQGFSIYLDIQLPEWESSKEWAVLPGLEFLRESGGMRPAVHGPLFNQYRPLCLVPSSVTIEGRAEHESQDSVWDAVERFVRLKENPPSPISFRLTAWNLSNNSIASRGPFRAFFQTEICSIGNPTERVVKRDNQFFLAFPKQLVKRTFRISPTAPLPSWEIKEPEHERSR